MAQRLAYLVLLVPIVACASSNDAAVRDAGPDSMLGDCPARASTCPASCYPIGGRAVDPANNCFLPEKTVACWLGTGGANHLFGCIEDPDTNMKYVVGSTSYIKDLAASGKWHACSTSVSQPCP